MRILRSRDARVEELAWGRLVWHASASLGNSDNLTVGRAVIAPGQQNGRHYHPNCEEVLQVIRGRIIHSWNGQEIDMTEGDVISIPPRVVHNARNVGGEPAEMIICFSNADRETVDVEDS